MKLKRTTSDHKDFQDLIKLLDNDLAARYSNHEYKYNVNINIDRLDTVVLAYINKVTIGCGCFKEINEDTVEIKRMYVHPQLRGFGVASAILEELSNWAKERYYINLVLETGKQQPEAIKLYSEHGFSIIENFGPYINSPGSLCMGKSIKTSSWR